MIFKRLSLCLLFISISTSVTYAADKEQEWKGFNTEDWGTLDSNIRFIFKAKKPVTLIFSNGDKVSGIIKAISKQGMIVMTELEGREFYEAAYLLSTVVGVEVRVKK